MNRVLRTWLVVTGLLLLTARAGAALAPNVHTAQDYRPVMTGNSINTDMFTRQGHGRRVAEGGALATP